MLMAKIKQAWNKLIGGLVFVRKSRQKSKIDDDVTGKREYVGIDLNWEPCRMRHI